jgi:cytochrome c oxidase subunit 2
MSSQLLPAPQSVLAPGGADAEAIALLSWSLFGGATGIFLGVIGVAACAYWGGPDARRLIGSQRFIVIGGIAFPAITLACLLLWGLVLTGARVVAKAPDALAIEVTGEQWWWRVGYAGKAGEASVTTANEIRIPVGREVEITLLAADVIHSFWAPGLGGKVDTIPGTVNRLRLKATRAGIYRGQCAEYCGGPHALMAFNVIAEEAGRFEAWLRDQRQNAKVPVTGLQKQGISLFQISGCGGCHTIRGSAAAGTIGPDLTHVAGRMTIAAGTLPRSGAFRSWIRDSQHIKPGNRMPAFGIFSATELDALAAYLESLE